MNALNIHKLTRHSSNFTLLAKQYNQKELFVLDRVGDKKKKISDRFPFEPIQPDTLLVFAGRNPEVSDWILLELIIIIISYLFICVEDS